MSLTHHYDDNGGQHLTGSEIILTNGVNLPFRTDGGLPRTPPVSLAKIECDDETLYVFVLQSTDGVIVHRFKKTGEMIDTLRVVLPSATRLTGKDRASYIWKLTRQNDGLAIMMANYSYAQTANLGGVIRQRHTYLVKVPD